MHRPLKHMLFACVWLFVLAGPSSADSLSDALHAFDEGHHATAAKLFKPLAEKGNSIAQFKLATMYYSGKGVPKNIREALRLYRLSAEQGHVVAQSNLATMYYLGKGVSRDFVLAHMWKNIAATNSEGDRQLRYFEQLKTLTNDMTARQIAEAQALAKQCTSNRFKGCKR